MLRHWFRYHGPASWDEADGTELSVLYQQGTPNGKILPLCWLVTKAQNFTQERHSTGQATHSGQPHQPKGGILSYWPRQTGPRRPSRKLSSAARGEELFLGGTVLVFGIETFFSDQKSRGFYLCHSHLSDPARLCRLLIATCLAYYWLVCAARVAGAHSPKTAPKTRYPVPWSDGGGQTEPKGWESVWVFIHLIHPSNS